MGLEVGVFVFYIILDLFSQVTHNKNDLIDTSLLQLINNDTYHCLSGERNKRFGLCVTLRAQLGACACYWNDSFHEWTKTLDLFKGKRK
jgi:hypothetical protein